MGPLHLHAFPRRNRRQVADALFQFAGSAEQCPLFKRKLTSLCGDKNPALDPTRTFDPVTILSRFQLIFVCLNLFY